MSRVRETRTHGSTCRGLETERYGVTAPAPDPTQPHRRRSFDSALNETVNVCYKSELIYGAARSGPCKIR